MNPKDERSSRDKMLRRLANHLREVGFVRGKSTFFWREAPLVIEFIHVHKFSFGPGFRIHAGLRVIADSFQAAALNGPDSDVYRCPDSPNGKRYRLSYSKDDESIDRCAEHAAEWCSDVAEPWFARWRNLDDLVADAESPLSSTAKAALSQSIDGIPSPDAVSISRAIVGLPRLPHR